MEKCFADSVGSNRRRKKNQNFLCLFYYNYIFFCFNTLYSYTCTHVRYMCLVYSCAFTAATIVYLYAVQLRPPLVGNAMELQSLRPIRKLNLTFTHCGFSPVRPTVIIVNYPIQYVAYKLFMSTIHQDQGTYINIMLVALVRDIN